MTTETFPKTDFDKIDKMESRNYLEILGQQKQGRFFKSDNLEERLLALRKILEFGYPSSIVSLIPFLKDENTEIQQTTCKVITELFKRIKTKKGYYDALRHCNISESDIHFYSKTFSNEDCVTLYSIATLNGNGYVRERALNRLAQSNCVSAIPFVVYRLADWVPAVQLAAVKTIENFKKSEFINALVDNLTIFEWLQKVERTDLSAIYADLMNFLVDENRNYVTENFKYFKDSARIMIAKQIATSDEFSSEDLKILLSDKHCLVRNLALLHFDKCTQSEINKLLTDRSARNRKQTLYSLKNKENFSEIVFPFLSDDSANIRTFARYSLKDTVSDFASIYNDNLLNKYNIIGSLCGLAETKDKQFVESLVPFLNDPKMKIRKAAFLALRHLDSSKAYNFALQNLDVENGGMRNLIVDYVSTTPTTEVLQRAREIYENGQYELKKSMLRLFSEVGKWTTIADIMIGTIDKNEDIRRLSLDYLRRWQNKAPRYFTQPKEGELERANQVFRFASEVHEEKKYFGQNPLIGIDFFLR